MEEYIREFAARYAQKDPEERTDGLWFDAPQIDVAGMAQFMLDHGVRLSTATAHDRTDGETDLIYHFIHGKTVINVRTVTQGQTIPSIANILPSANWIEREMRDLYAVHFEGHPDPRPLVRPKEMPEGFFRKTVAEGLLKEKEAK